MVDLRAPEPLAQKHKLGEFSCGQPSLDEWLKRRAYSNQVSGATRTFVVADEDDVVRGYYALATGAVGRKDATRAVRQNMPDPIPVIVLARLAVDMRMQGRKIGPAMLRDAHARSMAVAENAGVRAMLVHALDARAKAFYEHYGFRPSPSNPMALLLRLPAADPTPDPRWRE